MLPPLALAPADGEAVLDMCASPGGKTSFLAQLAGRSGYVLGNEPGADRLATLRQNMARMNLPQAVTTGAKGQDLALPDASFGYILLDPPCSGWGTAEKNPQVLTLWRPDKVEPLVALQRALLAKAERLLAAGGSLLYSTCTTNLAENEEQVAWAAAELGLRVSPLPLFEGFSFHEPLLPAAQGTLRVDGEGSQSQGFYLALLVKPESAGGTFEEIEASHTGVFGQGNTADMASGDVSVEGARKSLSAPGAGVSDRAQPRKVAARKVRKAEPPSNGSGDIPAEALRDASLAWENLPPGFFELFKDEMCFIPARGRDLLPPRRKGQRVGSLKGGVFRPWARARLLLQRPGAGPELNVDETEPLSALLEGRSIQTDVKSGRMGLYFRGLPLGFLTVKGGRALWSDR
jgi:16S rRNA (cytosine1407-C5)-methyltransferase